MRARLALLVGLVALASASGATERDSSSVPFGPGEMLTYNLKWEFIKGGEARMSVSEHRRDSTLLDINSLAWSTGIVDMFYTVRDTIVSTIDRDTLWPVRFEKRQHEGSYHRDSTYVFDQSAGVIHRGGGSFACSTRVHDILSVLYRVRTYELDVGRSFSTTVYEGGKLYSARVEVLRRERVTVPAGTFDCIVAEPILKSDAIFKQKGRLWIWFTDDDRRIPVLMASEVPVGEITAELTAYEAPAAYVTPSSR